jgi:hypothetical protein
MNAGAGAMQATEVEGIDTITTKITIKESHYEHDMYAKLGWHSGRPVWVSITLSRLNRLNGHDESPELVEVRRKYIDSLRAALEVICAHASEELRHSLITLDGLVSSWRATKFDPAGVCHFHGHADGVLVSSPLDAVARLIDERKEIWTRQMLNT